MKKIILWFLTISCATTIFMLSGQTAETSRGVSQGFTYMIFSFFKGFRSLPVSRQTEIVLNAQHIIRKMAHFSIYAILGLLVFLLVRSYGVKCLKAFIECAVICFLYASSDEIHQMFVSERGPLITDVILDTVGSCTGAIFVILLGMFSRKIRGRLTNGKSID